MNQNRAFPYLFSALMLAVTLVILWMMGRNLISPSGTVKLWHGANATGWSSQDLMDWYTPSHLLHGFIFYAALWFVARRLSLGWRFAIAMGVECAWEILENTNAVIDRYRAVTVSVDYNGDSVINSFVDVLAMAVGFALSRVLPVWVSVAIVIGFEVLTAFLIRDGLALNVIMLLAPVESILDWQAGG